MNPTARPTQRKPKRIKARIKWEDSDGNLWSYHKNAGDNPKRIGELDLSDEAALIRQVADAICAWPGNVAIAVSVLDSLGLITRKRTRK